MRNIKKLGLVAVAALALSALWAASASAQLTRFEAGSYPAKVTGTEEGIATLVTAVGTVNCSTSLSGEISAATTVASLGMSGYCKSFGIKNSFQMNGCSVELSPGWEAFGFGTGGCGPITMKIWNCTVSIPSQNGLYATYKSTASGVKVSLQAEHLRYSGCGAGDNEGGSFTATWNLSGVQLGQEFGPWVYAAEKYTTNLTGSQEEEDPNVIGTEAGSITCNSATFSGSLTATSESVTLTPAYSECSAWGFLSATVAMNGCKYVYSADSNLMSVTCPSESSITVTALTCAISIPAQSAKQYVWYETRRSSETGRKEFRTEGAVDGLTYTVTKDGFICPFAGTGTRTDGTYTGKTLFEGVNAEGRPVSVGVGDYS